MGIFDGLSERQKEAVETIDEDLEIIACAGAGKTGVVTRRIVNILKQKKDVTPANIVAFTFTEKAAEELKSRIYKYAKKELGSTVGFAEMYIGTIHGFCLKMLQEYIPQFQSFSVLDEIKTKLFIDKNYFECGMKDLDLKMYRETGLFLSTMSMLNESWESRDSWDKTTFDAVEKYKELLYSQHYFDYSLILREMLDQMQKNDEFRKRITSRVKFLTVDEYQDTNSIQEKLIQLIKNGGSNLCIVGDDDQTIYQFRGSDSENILTFKERYGVEKYIVLDTDYRSSEAIVDIAQRVIINNNRRLSKNMVSGAKFKYEEGDTIYREFEDIEQECDFIAGRIKALHESGVKYSEMAVLLRKKKFGEYFSETFDKYGIPYIVEGVNALFSTAECQASRGIFRYLNGEISMTDLFNLWKEVNYELDLKDLSDALTYLSGIDVKKMKYYGEFVLQEIYHNFLRLIYITEQEENAITEVILYNLGKFSQVINDFESINFATLPKNKLARFCKFMEYTASDYYPEGHLDNTYIRPDAVNIMTVHQSKGLEYTAVFVPELSKNNFPAAGVGGKNVWHIINRDWIQNSERFNSGIEEERRLFYVAVTRAKKYLCLTRCPYRRDKKISTFLVEAKESPYMLSYDDKMEYSGKQLPPMVEEKSAINLNFSILQDFFDCAYRFKLSMFYGFILEKVYKFKLDKAQALRNLSVYLMLLYGELYYWICNIEELEKDRKLEIPKNLFSGKKPIIESYLWNISRVDYCDFWRKGDMQEKFEMFAKDGIDEIRALQSKMFYLEIALNEKEINVCKNIPYTGDEYKVLHIISDWLQQACDDIEPVLQQIEKEEKNFDWKCQKEKIVENYTGLFTEDLKEFIKNEQNTTMQVDKDDTQGDCHHENKED